MVPSSYGNSPFFPKEGWDFAGAHSFHAMHHRTERKPVTLEKGSAWTQDFGRKGAGDHESGRRHCGLRSWTEGLGCAAGATPPSAGFQAAAAYQSPFPQQQQQQVRGLKISGDSESRRDGSSRATKGGLIEILEYGAGRVHTFQL